MLGTLKVHLAKAIASVRVTDATPVERRSEIGGTGATLGEGAGSQLGASALGQGLDGQKTELSELLQALRIVVDKLNQFYDEVFAGHKEEIAKLSVEIARKILTQKVQEGDYEIESIVQGALNNAPTRHDVVVYLNPEDFAQCQKAQEEETGGALSGIKFVADSNIGRSECLVETPKGTIESLIEENLKRVCKALEKAE